MVRWSPGVDPSDSDLARPRRVGPSKYGVRSLLLEICSRGTEPWLWLLLDLRLLVDRSDGSLLDLTDDFRSGTMTTGIAPFFQTSLLALPLEMELNVATKTTHTNQTTTKQPNIGRLLPVLMISSWSNEVG